MGAFERLCKLIVECLQGNRNYRLLLLPQFVVIGIWLLLFSREGLFAEVFFWGLHALWVAFIAWRWLIVIKQAAAIQDRKYDSVGKFRLAREYWNTESVTASGDMAKRKIWWERWGNGYKPTSWKAWAWLGAFCCSVWPVLFTSEWLAKAYEVPNVRVVSALSVLALVGWGFWFVERHTTPRT